MMWSRLSAAIDCLTRLIKAVCRLSDESNFAVSTFLVVQGHVTHSTSAAPTLLIQRGILVQLLELDTLRMPGCFVVEFRSLGGALVGVHCGIVDCMVWVNDGN